MRCLAFAGCICVVSQLWVVGMILLAWVKYSSCFITVYEVGVIGFGCSLYSFNSIFFLLFSHTKSIPTFFFNDIWRSIQHPIDIIYFSLCLSYHIINIYTYNYMLVFFSLRIEIRFEYPSHISKTRGARGLRAPTKWQNLNWRCQSWWCVLNSIEQNFSCLHNYFARKITYFSQKFIFLTQLWTLHVSLYRQFFFSISTKCPPSYS